MRGLQFIFLILGGYSAAVDAEINLDSIISSSSKRGWQKQLHIYRQGQQERACREELSLKLLPANCYGISNITAEVLGLLDRQCEQATGKIENLEVIMRHLKHDQLSPNCRATLFSRGRILAYKLEDHSPNESFKFLRRNAGTDLEDALGHAQPSAK